MAATILSLPTSASSSPPPASSSREARLLHAITSCDATRELYERARAASNPHRRSDIALGHWTFTFAPSTTSGFAGECNHQLQNILLSDGLSDEEAIGIATFELTNAEQSAAFAQVEKDLREGKISIEQYAKRMEEIEDAGTVEHHRIMKIAREQTGWGSAVDQFHVHATGTFADRWLIKKDLPHAEYYRNYARKVIRERVEGAMRAAGFSESEISLYTMDQLESCSLFRNDTELRAYFISLKEQMTPPKKTESIERVEKMMSDIGLTESEISGFSFAQLEKFSEITDETDLREALKYERDLLRKYFD